MFCFFKQKTAYEMRISDWSSDVCSSDLPLVTRKVSFCTRSTCPNSALLFLRWKSIAEMRALGRVSAGLLLAVALTLSAAAAGAQIGRAAWRERVCKYVKVWGVAV